MVPTYYFSPDGVFVMNILINSSSINTESLFVFKDCRSHCTLSYLGKVVVSIDTEVLEDVVTDSDWKKYLIEQYTADIVNPNNMVLESEVDPMEEPFPESEVDTMVDLKFSVMVFDTKTRNTLHAICLKSEINNTIVRLSTQIINDKK